MTVLRRRVFSALVVLQFIGLVAVSFVSSALAAELPRPEGKVILVIKGAIANTNAPGVAEFDYAMLENLGFVTEQVDTSWTPVGAVFEGVRTRKLLEFVGATGRRITATAANDYSVSLPLEDLAEYDTLLASSRDGVRLRLRDQGPLWLVYVPRDQPDEIQAVLNHRMVWQLNTLEVE